MTKLLKSKKAQAPNYFAAIMFLFVFGVLNIFAYGLLYNVILEYQNTGFWSTESEYVANSFLASFALFDYVIVALTLIFIIAVAITSYKIAIAKVFFILTIILGLIYGYVAYIISYVFQQIVSDAFFQTFIHIYPRTYFILSNLHWIAFAMIVVGSYTLYAKKDRGQYEPQINQ